MPIAKTIDRRLFLAGAAGVSLAGAANATLIAPGASAGETRALEAIAAYLQSHRRHHGLPAMGMVWWPAGATSQFFRARAITAKRSRWPAVNFGRMA